ncbi:hypothetical protein J3F83DRAFT_226882 [Trichoderma novae-zelandiae]
MSDATPPYKYAKTGGPLSATRERGGATDSVEADTVLRTLTAVRHGRRRSKWVCQEQRLMPGQCPTGRTEEHGEIAACPCAQLWWRRICEKMRLGWLAGRIENETTTGAVGGDRRRLAPRVSNQLDEGWTRELARVEHRGCRGLVSWDDICTPSRRCLSMLQWNGKVPWRCPFGEDSAFADVVSAAERWMGNREVAKSRRRGLRGKRRSSRVRDVHPSPIILFLFQPRAASAPRLGLVTQPTSVSANYVVQGFGSIVGSLHLAGLTRLTRRTRGQQPSRPPHMYIQYAVNGALCASSR